MELAMLLIAAVTLIAPASYQAHWDLLRMSHAVEVT